MKSPRASGNKSCRVCDRPLAAGGGKSREHVLPDWMQKHFGLSARKISYTPMESSDVPTSMQLTPSAPEHLQRSHNYGSMLLGAVCKNCNNGWMSKIEGEAKADLISLIEGAPVSNAPEAVARWAVKTAYIFTVATNPPVGRVPQRHILHLKQNSGLPPGVAVFFRTDCESEWWFSSSTTFLVEADASSVAATRDFALKHQRNAYRYFFRLGRLTLMVHFWPNSVDPVAYNEHLIRPLSTGVRLRAWHDGHPGLEHLLYDLAMRSTACRLNSEERGDVDLCFCGSGLLTGVCRLMNHPADTAANWGGRVSPLVEGAMFQNLSSQRAS